MTAYYLYGITRPRALPRRLVDAGISTIDDGERAAVVSEVEPRPVEPTRRNLLAHADAVEELHQQEVVLPARFGIVLDDRDAVLGLLAMPEVEQLLVRHRTTCELRLRGEYDESVLATLDAGPARDAYRRAPTVENGIALGEVVAGLLADRRAADTARVLDRIEPGALALRRSEAAGELDAFSVACLVERDAADDLSARLDELATELSPPLRFTLVGPLPPYSFVDLEAPALV